MDTWGILELNYGNSDVTLVLYLWLTDSYEPQAQRVAKKKLSAAAASSIAYAPNFNIY